MTIGKKKALKMNVSKALKEIFKQDFSCSTENIYLKDSFGRTLSKPVTINKSIPEFDTSSMDGFAVRKSSLGKIFRFTVLGETPLALDLAIRLSLMSVSKFILDLECLKMLILS